MRADGSSVDSCATMTSQGSIVFIILYCDLAGTAHELRQGTRRARAELPASDPAHEEGAHRSALGAGAEGARHGPGIGEGFQTFARQTGHELLSHDEANREFTFFMKKK